MNAIRRFTSAAMTLFAVIALAITPVATAAPARASLMDIENSVMCVVCNEPLAVANSPQAYQERNFIRGLIAQGETKRQIERALVANYGIAVLGKPPARGFNLTVYVLPPAVLAAGLALLAFTLPRWRRRVRAKASAPTPDGPSLSPAEQRRLDEELSRFAG
jgi:cytochrome c-type biogenesis protein CcmH